MRVLKPVDRSRECLINLRCELLVPKAMHDRQYLKRCTTGSTESDARPLAPHACKEGRNAMKNHSFKTKVKRAS